MQAAENGPHLIFGISAKWVAGAILALSCVLSIAERLNRSTIALLGTSRMIVSDVHDQNEAIKGIDFNTLAGC